MPTTAPEVQWGKSIPCTTCGSPLQIPLAAAQTPGGAMPSPFSAPAPYYAAAPQKTATYLTPGYAPPRKPQPRINARTVRDALAIASMVFGGLITGLSILSIFSLPENASFLAGLGIAFGASGLFIGSAGLAMRWHWSADAIDTLVITWSPLVGSIGLTVFLICVAIGRVVRLVQIRPGDSAFAPVIVVGIVAMLALALAVFCGLIKLGMMLCRETRVLMLALNALYCSAALFALLMSLQSLAEYLRSVLS
jgi:hypothetical protein